MRRRQNVSDALPDASKVFGGDKPDHNIADGRATKVGLGVVNSRSRPSTVARVVSSFSIACSMPKKASATTYGPLSIGETECDGGAQLPPSLSPRVVSHSLRRLLCRRSKFYVILLFLFSMVALALHEAKVLFHLNFLNLLRLIFGGNKKVIPTVAICSSSQRLENDETAAGNIYFSKTTVEDLDLNMRAFAFKKSFVGADEVVTTGFLWNEQDSSTTKWRPQGVTTYHGPNSGRRFVLISWYSRKDEGYSDHGGKISFVDISGMQRRNHNTTSQQYSYCHVLLVDQDFCTLPDIHVGGIEQQNGTLYVADSRKGMQSILEFDLANGLYEMPSDLADSVFGYHYVLRQSSSFHSPTKPSFISYDIDIGKFVVGTYARCGGKVGIHVDSDKCLSQPQNRLVWFDKSNVDLINGAGSNNTDDSCAHYFSEMQGAASAKVGNDIIIWVSSSYGPVADSHLHVVNASQSFNGKCPEVNNINSNKVRILSFPPGLEDLHIEQAADERYMWMATEFGARMVFSTLLDNLYP